MPAEPPVSGELRIGPYLLRRRLGEGGMGVVWLAHDTDLDRDVAIKELRLPQHTHKSANRAVQRFLREARAAARLSHPNCVTVHHVTREGDQLYIVMECVDGGSLADQLRRTKIHWRDATRLIRDAAMGLSAAHDAGLIHRDIKPSNILLNSRGVVKVADFGLARAAGWGSDVTQRGALVGTPAFMSPEQCRGEELDARSDLYSLLCTFYTLLTGQQPFTAEAIATLIHKHLTEPLPDPRGIVSDIPQPICDIIARGTQKDREARYQTAAELIDALGDAIGASASAENTLRVATIIEALPSARSHEIPNNLPQQLSSFIGRDREITKAMELIGTSRLLTLTGAGGTGKTRLAQNVAERILDRFDDGVWWIDLAPLNQPNLVVPTVATVVGLREPGAQTVALALPQFLRDKSMLIVLDNCEHLVAACATLADSLGRACPNVRILTTSRQPLNLAGETTLRVPSLAVPSAPSAIAPAELERFESVRLFADRAAAAKPGFVLGAHNARAIAEICRQLDGIPLALELAAARVTVLSLDQIASRLSDRFRLLVGGSRASLPRQQTLRAMVDWSYELLDPSEKLLLARLSIFAGGCTLDAAEIVCADERLDAVDILDLITSLVDKSMVLAEEFGPATHRIARYRMLDTLRHYAAEKLRADTEAHDALTSKHAHWALEFAKSANAELRGPEQDRWLTRLDLEHDNLRAALDWCAMHNRGDMSVRFIAWLGRYWYRRGLLREGAARSEVGLRLSGAEPRILERAEALVYAGILAMNHDDSGRAAIFFRESLGIAREIGDRKATSIALNYLGNISRTLGDYPQAMASYNECLAISRALGDKQAIAATLGNLGNILKDLARPDDARRSLEECLVIHRELKDKTSLAYTMLNLGDLELHECAPEAALRWLTECRTMLAELKDEWSELYAIEAIARAKFLAGDLAGARPIFEQVLPRLREFGDHSYIAITLFSLGEIELAEGNLDAAKASFGEALAIRKRLHERRYLLMSMEAAARWLLKRAHPGDAVAALTLLTSAERHRADAGLPIPPYLRASTLAAREAATRAANGAEVLTLDFNAAVDLALGKLS